MKIHFTALEKTHHFIAEQKSPELFPCVLSQNGIATVHSRINTQPQLKIHQNSGKPINSGYKKSDKSKDAPNL